MDLLHYLCHEQSLALMMLCFEQTEMSKTRFSRQPKTDDAPQLRVIPFRTSVRVIHDDWYDTHKEAK